MLVIPYVIYAISALLGSAATFVFLRFLPIPWYFSPFLLWGLIAGLSVLLFAMIGYNASKRVKQIETVVI